MPSQRVGYTLDLILLATAGYLASRHPAWDAVRQKGLMPAVADIPSPRTVFDAQSKSGVLLAPILGQESTPFTVETQRWFDYVLDSDLGPAAAHNSNLRTFYEMNEWKNSLILPASVRNILPHTVAIYLRNLIAGVALYYISGFIWIWWIYYVKSDKYFPNKADMPSWEDMRIQMGVSTSALFAYVLMPTWGEWLIEKGATHTYDTLADIGGLGSYCAWLAAYIFFVEWGIYWVHRYLHDNKTLYLWLHKPHHIYNNKHALSPFAGLAFHPIDGMLQASPYLVGLFLMPVHFWTHEVLLFFTAIWTANIHDTLVGDTEPVMGSAYHTLHHTLYKDNYGQFFVFFDWVHDTLTPPKHRRAVITAQGKGAPSETPTEPGYVDGKVKAN